MKTDADRLELTVLLPCLNEALTLEGCIRSAQDAIAKHGIRGEVLIADNGSTDGSPAIAERLGARVVHVARKGYGSALMGGIEAAAGEVVMMADADQSYDLTQPHEFLAKLNEGFDLVMGNRFMGGIKEGAMPFLHRYLGNPVLSGIARLFFRCPCRDLHCGLRAFRKDAIIGLDLQTTGMEFASEMVVKATLHKLRIAEIATTLSPDARDRPPHLRTWRDGWRHLRFLLMYSPRWLFLYPGFALMIMGALIGVLGLTQGAGLGLKSQVAALLIAAAGVCIGYQSAVFAMFAKIFAITEGLLPEDPRLNNMFKVITLENGLLVGIFLAIGGVAGNIWAITAGEEPHLLVLAPSVVATILGFQTILSSFFLSMLGLARR